ncbi:MAG TPA: pyridoxal-phosphate dependent enzyme [Longimicrobiales bacterium]|nr:pyridoxal-phosphate dependent enzyme [Longimicrobiales bacterium]
MSIALFDVYPELAGRIPWVRLGTFPTPVEALAVGRSDVFIKRDDLSAQPYGGNKVRKLEFLLAAAQARRARRLITVGAAGSHHALATTIYGKQLGFDVTLILFPQPLTAHVRDILLLDVAYGAELRYTGRMETVPTALFATSMRYRRQGAFVIAAGGSDAIGTLGYVNAALELAAQIRLGNMPQPASIVAAAGTLGTVAGLALGFALAQLPIRILGVRITSRIVTNERALMRLIRGADDLLRRAGIAGTRAEQAFRSVEIRHEQMGSGYGVATAAGDAAAHTLSATGIHLDTTYTAKAAAALLQHVKAAAGPVLFWHTLSAAEPPLPAHVRVDNLPTPFQTYLQSQAGAP